MYTWNLDNAVARHFPGAADGKSMQSLSILERNSITQSHWHTTARIFDKILCSSCQRVMQFPKHEGKPTLIGRILICIVKTL